MRLVFFLVLNGAPKRSFVDPKWCTVGFAAPFSIKTGTIEAIIDDIC